MSRPFNLRTRTVPRRGVLGWMHAEPLARVGSRLVPSSAWPVQLAMARWAEARQPRFTVAGSHQQRAADILAPIKPIYATRLTHGSDTHHRPRRHDGGTS